MMTGYRRLLSMRAHGAALLWTLLMCGFLALVTLSFLSVSSAARSSSSREQHRLVTEELTDAAQQEILAKLADAFSVESGAGAARSGHVAATPGLLEVRRYDVTLNRGTHTAADAFKGTQAAPAFFSQPFAREYSGKPANPRWIPLFSWRALAPRVKHLAVGASGAVEANPGYNPAAAFNLNTPNNPFTPGVCLLSGVPAGSEILVRERHNSVFADSANDAPYRLGTGQSSAERPVWVQWIPILKNPGLPPSRENPMIGRYAYWVDVENSKLRMDQPLQSWRETPQFARLSGEPDASESGGKWFKQSQTNSARQLRVELEKLLPLSKGEDDQDSQLLYPSRGDADVIGFAAGAAAEGRQAWLGWRNGKRPPMADARIVDWDYFEAPWPKGYDSITVAGTLESLAGTWSEQPGAKPPHPWFLARRDLKGLDAGEMAKEKLLRQVASSSLTVWGHEEEVDPLGRAKLDLPGFQLAVTHGRAAPVSLAAVESSELWRRLQDKDYYRAYFPGAWPTGGVAKSFMDTWNRFAGNGDPAQTANGEALVRQMLVNLAEFAQPASVPPLVDTERGIVGARSMPYVAEVTTRARSAFWLLPEHDRNNPDKLLKRENGEYTYTYEGKDLRYYATHVVIDLMIGLVNPNPFETVEFEGELELDVAWQTGLPAGAEVRGGTLKAPLKGLYTLTPEPNKDAKAAQAHGTTVYFDLGVVPAAMVVDANNDFPTALRIQGWRILRGGAPWHQVPVRHPGGAGTRAWWQMAQAGQNAGYSEDANSLQAYADGGRAVGWFCKMTPGRLLPDSLVISDWPESTVVDDSLSARVEKWSGLTRRTAMLERVVSMDPVLGHRTGDDSIPGARGSGHFYGALGHTWRRKEVHALQGAPAAGASTPVVKVVGGQAWKYQPNTEFVSQVTVLQRSGDRLVKTQVPWSRPVWSAEAEGQVVSGEYLTHALATASSAQADMTPKAAESLTGLYVAPSVTGPVPQGKMKLEEYFKELKLANGEKIKIPDVESVEAQPDAGDFTKTPDGKKGVRSLVCSAPAGRPFLAVGEIGFCHSGLAQTPVIVGPDEGRTVYQMNCPRNGPPMRMLLDLFAAPQFVDDQGRELSEGEWLAGRGSITRKRHAWNVNTTIAHDDYMAIRQGGDTLAELKKEVDPAKLTARVAWIPNAQGFARRLVGTESFRGKEAKHMVEKNPGFQQDRHLRPYPALGRPWDMWQGVIGGDFSPGRSGESLNWGVGSTTALYFGPGYLTWEPGKGTPATTAAPWVDFKSDVPAYGRLLAFGVDARKDDKQDKVGFLKGRFAADQNLGGLSANLAYYVPAHFATRFSLLPVRHFVSDLAVDFHQENHESEWTFFKTGLNPGISSDNLPDPTSSAKEDKAAQEVAKKLDGAAFPGGWHRSGIYYNAPMTLLTNQAGVSANAFTAYVVVQAVRDKGASRAGVAQSGYGYCDPDDEVLAQRWSRMVIVKETSASGPPQFKVAMVDVAGR